MSLENNLASIAKSLETIAAHLTKDTPKTALAQQLGSMPVVAGPVTAMPLPPFPTAATTPLPQPPTIPPLVPTSSPTVTAAPFSDTKGLNAYVIESYRGMGAEKGARIQGVLEGLGYKNINDVKPEHYAALHQGIEALK